MVIQQSDYPRGSEWRLWDLHIHTPASFHWEGRRFSPTCDQAEDYALVDEMIAAMNAAKPAVFAVMDYWTFEGWFALKRRLSQPNAPKLEKTVFPGIELRLSAPMEGRLNAHAIFADDIPDQALRDFLSHLRLELTDQSLSSDALRAYARSVGADKLSKHRFKKADVDNDDAIALTAGHSIAKIKSDSYKEALRRAPEGRALGYMPFNTNDGLGSVEWVEHYAYVMTLFDSSPIFEARDDATWNAFVGRRTTGNAKWIDNFQSALRDTPRLPVSGSDSHRFIGTAGDNNKRGYGDYPSSRATWIKADPTWLGLLQAIKEPMKRCHIGEIPPKLQHVASNKTFYMESVKLAKDPSSKLPDKWFDGCQIPLNTDLVAIIGNKGSGKSALADVLALLGHSQQSEYFSFLKTNRFRGKSGEPAKQFIGQLNWHAGDPCTCNLGDNPPANAVELVRYIPQGRFEALCNEHVSGKSEAFERELRALVFSHIPKDSRLNAPTFEHLIEEQEKLFRARLGEERRKLENINRKIAAIEEEMQPDLRKHIEEQLKLKIREIEEATAAEPKAVPAPSEALTDAQKEASQTIGKANAAIVEAHEKLSQLAAHQTTLAARRQAANAAIGLIDLFLAQSNHLRSDLAIELEKLGLQFNDVVSISVDKSPLDNVLRDATEQGYANAVAATLFKEAIATQGALIESSTEALNGPQQAHQAYTIALRSWQERLAVIIGSADAPDSRKGLESRLALLDTLPDQIKTLRLERIKLSSNVYDILEEQRSTRAALFARLQELVSENHLIGADYRLKFQANLSASSDAISENIFSIVKQNVGEIRGEDESREAVRARFHARDLNLKADALAFVEEIHQLLHANARKLRPNDFDLEPILRKDRGAAEVYNYLYGLEYVQPHYTLLFQDTPIEQLSPGQRGALLLIFYLLVDNKRNPIVIDQPEENLDNETVVNLLVPVVNAAKDHRQILMVTHNPNLAVVCDAEQIILAQFDRTDGASISYVCGSIESPTMNEHVVTVLEGTKPAFNNRSGKYH